MFEFIIYGKPVPKQRPRFVKGIVYTPKATVQYEKLVAKSFLTQGGKSFDDSALQASICLHLAVPKSYTKKEKQAIMDGTVLPTKSPDVDNVAKSILDGLNNVAYTDDRQILSLSIKKQYSFDTKAPFTVVKIEKVE